MTFKFNGGRGAILCEKCGVILKEGNQISEYVWEAVRNGTVSQLPDMYCEDGCERSMKVLAESDRIMNKIKEESKNK
jgi:S-adenosylhomocysteine hydrolase